MKHRLLVIGFNKTFGLVYIEFVLPVVERSIAVSGIVSNCIILIMSCILGVVGFKWRTGKSIFWVAVLCCVVAINSFRLYSWSSMMIFPHLTTFSSDSHVGVDLVRVSLSVALLFALVSLVFLGLWGSLVDTELFPSVRSKRINLILRVGLVTISVLLLACWIGANFLISDFRIISVGLDSRELAVRGSVFDFKNDVVNGIIIANSVVCLIVIATLLGYQILSFVHLRKVMKTSQELARLQSVKWNIILSAVLAAYFCLRLPIDVLQLTRFDFYSQSLSYLVRMVVVEFITSFCFLAFTFISWFTSWKLFSSATRSKIRKQPEADFESQVPLLYSNY